MNKKLNIAIVIAATVFAVGCNDNKEGEKTVTTTDSLTTTVTTDVAPTNTTSTTTTTTTRYSGTAVESGKLPAPVTAAFTKKYPKAQNPTWLIYTPVEEDYFPADYTYYYTTVPGDAGDYWVWYNDKGEWVRTVEAMPKDSRLPDAVNKTINDQYPGYTIEEVSKENDKDADMYEIKLNKGDQKAKLKVLPDGTVFKRKEKTK